MEYAMFMAAIAAALIGLFIKGHRDGVRQKRQTAEKLSAAYGKLPQKEYLPEMLAAAAAYYKKHPKEGQIDDITWNGLDMDSIFQRMDYTHSGAGAEYLYYTLRTPKYREEEFAKMQEWTVYFMEHEKERVAMQELFMELSTAGRHSLYDYLDYLGNAGLKSPKRHLAMDFLLAVLAVCSFASPVPAFFALAGVVICQIFSYLREKAKVEPYLVSLSYIMRLFSVCGKLQKTVPDLFLEEKEELAACRRKFRRFARFAFLVTADTGTGAGPLDVMLVYVKMIFHLDLIKFYHMLADIRNHEADIDRMATIAGSIETAISIGAFRVSAGCCCIPVFSKEPVLKAHKMYHPLLASPVKNDITAMRGVLVTGSNASGKSTFLKTAAVNAILAQTIHCALAERFCTSFFRIYSSMALKDNLAGGESYYIVEVKAMQRILQAFGGKASDTLAGMPVLCFVDEPLRGTNTVERIAASTQILKGLSRKGALCFAATHDVELTYLLEDTFDNYYFKEEVTGNDLRFDYKLLAGRSTQGNAIRLLAVMGYEEEIVAAAKDMAAFLAKAKESSAEMEKA